MAEVEVREEGDGVWHFKVPGANIGHTLHDELTERCYELGWTVVGGEGDVLHVSPRADLAMQVDSALQDLKEYLAQYASGSS
jgi:hypothetical protein